MEPDQTESPLSEPNHADAESHSGPVVEVLQLDAGAANLPLFTGPDPEPLALDWDGKWRPALLVTSGAEDAGRTARLFQPSGVDERGMPIYGEGEPLPALDGLRTLCSFPNGRASRFDLVGLAPEGLVLLPNEGTAEAPRFGGERLPLGLPADLGLGSGRVAQMVADDWDGDGRVDLLVGFDDLADYWPPDLAAQPEHQRPGFNQSGAHTGYDRNGRWRGGEPHGRLFWLRNTGEPGQPSFQPPEEITATSNSAVRIDPHPAPLAIAWGASRGIELLVADDAGTVRLHRNFGGQRPPVLLEPRPLKQDGEPLRLPADRTTVTAADLDVDGRDELLVGTADGQILIIRPGRSRDEAEAPVPLASDGRCLRFGAGAVVDAADLDHDGDLDLIAGDRSGRLWLAQDCGGPGDHRYAAPVELDAGGLPLRLDPGPDGRPFGPISPPLGFATVAVADWDGNGRPDLVVSGAGGEVLFLHHNGGPTQPRFERPIPLRCEGGPLVLPPRVRPALADWKGSGHLDLIGLDVQGFLALYARTGNNEVAAPMPLTDRLGRLLRLDGAFGLGGGCSLWAGQWTGSGRLDLLVGLPRANRHVIPALTGQAPTDLELCPTVLLLEQDDRGRFLPRPLRFFDGRPVVVGQAGCSPRGVDWSGTGRLDLLIGDDDGRVLVVPRDALSW